MDRIMADDQNLNEQLGVDLNITDKNEPPEKSSRRRFLAAAAVSTPLMISSLSKPAWGAGLGNRLCWSGIQSGNVSREPNLNCFCGKSPGYYKSSILPHGGDFGWPASVGSVAIDHGLTAAQIKGNGRIKGVARDLVTSSGPGLFPGTLFEDLFASVTPYAGYTLLQVLWQFPGSFGFHAIATIFNTVQYAPYVWETPTAMEIINDILLGGVHTDSMDRTFTESEMQGIFDGQYC